MNKMCEICGNLSNEAYYLFVSSLEYTVYLDSPQINYFDRENGIVYFNNGCKYQINGFTSKSEAIFCSHMTTHIFCSETCENNFLNMYKSLTLYEAALEIGILSHKKDFCPVLYPLKNFKYDLLICEQCNQKYPNSDKIYKIIPIEDTQKLSGNLKNPPHNKYFSFIFSDMHENKLDGNYYQIKLNHGKENWKFGNFCSNECVYEYSKKTDSLIIFKNNIMKGYITAITKFSKDINNGLSQPYILRPQIFSKGQVN
jgi:hypothetical protein